MGTLQSNKRGKEANSFACSYAWIKEKDPTNLHPTTTKLVVQYRGDTVKQRRFSHNLGFALKPNIMYTMVALDNPVCLASRYGVELQVSLL